MGSTNLFNAVFIRPEQVVRFLLCTQQKMNNLFRVDENSIEHCFAANIVQGCQQYCSALIHLIKAQQYCLILLTA